MGTKSPLWTSLPTFMLIGSQDKLWSLCVSWQDIWPPTPLQHKKYLRPALAPPWDREKKCLKRWRIWSLIWFLEICQKKCVATCYIILYTLVWNCIFMNGSPITCYCSHHWEDILIYCTSTFNALSQNQNHCARVITRWHIKFMVQQLCIDCQPCTLPYEYQHRLKKVLNLSWTWRMSGFSVARTLGVFP